MAHYATELKDVYQELNNGEAMKEWRIGTGGLGMRRWRLTVIITGMDLYR